MNYEHIWKVLETLIVEFGKKGIKVPKQYLADLKSAQTFIRIHNSEPSDSNVVAEIERYIDTVEIMLGGTDYFYCFVHRGIILSDWYYSSLPVKQAENKFSNCIIYGG